MANNGIVECASVNLHFFDTLKRFASLSCSGTNIEAIDNITCFNSVEIAIAIFLAGN